MKRTSFLLLLFILLFLVSGCYYSQSDVDEIIEQKDNVYSELQEKYDKLSADYENLSSEYHKLSSKYDDLYSDYATISEDNYKYEKLYLHVTYYQYMDDNYHNYDDALADLYAHFEDGSVSKKQCKKALDFLYSYILGIFQP